ncbi:lipopolysaccharide biosynthesis protein [Methylobacterium sp. WSM2598]|uniref:lipopolysaccharide biosynthesis protein n=1 Tax=Methylobacterium sp. WSM2598 TaxID=398261 RepID=UPI00039F51A3|nr:lipopolysaccharide biosynthesis protein [Methylobacterium sp. WSM2598]
MTVRPPARLARLLTGSAALAAIRLGGAGFGFVAQAFLARFVGAHDLGLFYAATSLAIVAGLLATQGYTQIASRFAARYRSPARRRLFAAFVATARRDSLAAAALFSGLIAGASLLAPGLDATTRHCGLLAGLLVLATTSLTLFTNLAGAIRLFGLCYVPEGIVRPAVFLVLVVGLRLAWPGATGDAVTALFTGLTVLIAVVQLRLLLPHLPPRRAPGRSARRLRRRWRREAHSLMLLSIYTNIFADLGILCVTPFLPKAEVAVFGLCLKLALLVGYVVQVTQQMAVPDLADARRAGDHAAMRRIVRRSLALPGAATLAALAAVLVAGAPLLSLFGPEFPHGAAALAILVGSQLLRALAGPSAHLVTLTGAQGLNARLCVLALLVLVAANLALTPAFGVTGAAGAVLASYAAWILATALVLRRLGEIRTDALSLLPGARRAAPTREGVRGRAVLSGG